MPSSRSSSNSDKRSFTCKTSFTTSGWKRKSSWRGSAAFGDHRSGPDLTNGDSISPKARAGCVKKWSKTTCFTFITLGDPSWIWATLMMPSTTREIKTWRQSIGESSLCVLMTNQTLFPGAIIFGYFVYLFTSTDGYRSLFSTLHTVQERQMNL